MTVEREIEIQKEIWRLQAELRDIHSERTGHDVWTHRRKLDFASRCFTCNVNDNPNNKTGGCDK